MKENLKFFFQRLTAKLWVKPLIFCLLSIGAALIAHLADNSFLKDITPDIEKKSLEDLLTTISSSMLVIAIFAVGSMLSAYAAASGSATPRSFKLIVADDVSQTALSVYIGSFIYSIVADIALKNGYYGEAGYFTLFILTLIVFALVILTFLRWVERISKLGRLGHTIKKVEEATNKALHSRLEKPFMGCCPVSDEIEKGSSIYSSQIGYVQHINIERLQEMAKDSQVTITIKCIPGVFVSPDKPLAFINSPGNEPVNINISKLIKAFAIDDSRSFMNDPRFGLIALSEISSRALSPGINDPGTAIAIIGSHVRLFTLWLKGIKSNGTEEVKYDRIRVPAISLADMFDDAFRPIARDGASNLEVMIRLQKAFTTLASVGNSEAKEIARMHSRQAYERAELKFEYKNDLDVLKRECLFN
ncbi:MAG: DUF2254 domain-containing protein [Ginsengibacter sp.]